jgi:hypothetical protein
MNENNESIKIFRCNICNKNYSSQSSLCNHNKKFHSKLILNSSIIPQESSKLPQELIENNLICIYCNKHYSRLDNIKRHYNTCKKNINNDKYKNKSEIIDNTIDKKLEEFKNTILDIIQKNYKIHSKTLKNNNSDIFIDDTSLQNIEIPNDNVISSSSSENIEDNKIIKSDDNNFYLISLITY